MEILEQIIQNMQKEELRFFDIYTSRMRYPEPRKDKLLLKKLRNASDTDESNMQQALGYNASSANAWYRLRNRLQEDLINSLHLQHIDQDDYSRTVKLICFARLQIEKSAYPLAANILKKAERIAEKAEQFMLLELIYAEYIRMAQKSLLADPVVYSQKRTENHKKLEQINRAEVVLASLNYRLGKNQRFSEEGKSGLHLLEELLQENPENPLLMKSPAFRIRTYLLMSRLLLQRKEYHDLESYLFRTYTEFENEGIFTRKRHELKLEMLTWKINALYYNGKYALAIEIAEQLHTSMRAFQSIAYEKYILFYCNALVINHVGLQQYKEGILLIENLLSDKKQKISEHYRLMIQVNLMYLYYLTQNYRKALRVWHTCTLLEAYKEAHEILKIKLEIAGIILLFENGNTDLVQTKADKFLKDLKKSKNISKEDLVFFEIVQKLPEVQAMQNLKTYLSKVKKLTETQNTPEDIIDYRLWLTNKIKAYV